MNVRNCKKCRRLFNYLSGPSICPACREALEVKFQEVKKFVQDHKNATIPMVTEECDVEAAQIQQWIREERLQFSDDSPIKVSCESCGTMIGSGRFCEKCKAEMLNNFKSVLPGTKTQMQQPVKHDSSKNRMRFLDK